MNIIQKSYPIKGRNFKASVFVYTNVLQSNRQLNQYFILTCHYISDPLGGIQNFQNEIRDKKIGFSWHGITSIFQQNLHK